MKKDPLEEIQTSPLNEDSSDEETIIQSNETKLHSCPEEASVSTITATTITNNLVPMVKVEPGEFNSLQDEYNDLQMTNEDVNETVEGEEDTTDSKNGLLVPVLEVNESTENDADIWVTKQGSVLFKLLNGIELICLFFFYWQLYNIQLLITFFLHQLGVESFEIYYKQKSMELISLVNKSIGNFTSCWHFDVIDVLSCYQWNPEFPLAT